MKNLAIISCVLLDSPSAESQDYPDYLLSVTGEAVDFAMDGYLKKGIKIVALVDLDGCIYSGNRLDIASCCAVDVFDCCNIVSKISIKLAGRRADQGCLESAARMVRHGWMIERIRSSAPHIL